MAAAERGDFGGREDSVLEEREREGRGIRRRKVIIIKKINKKN